MESPAGLTALGYVGIHSARLDEWDSYATRLLGMQQVDRGGAVRAFRMDDRKQRLVVAGGEGEGLGFLGWEARDAAALELSGGAAGRARRRNQPRAPLPGR